MAYAQVNMLTWKKAFVVLSNDEEEKDRQKVRNKTFFESWSHSFHLYCHDTFRWWTTTFSMTLEFSDIPRRLMYGLPWTLSSNPNFCNTGLCCTSFIHTRFRLTISVTCTTLHVNQYFWFSQNTHLILFVNEWYIDALYISVFNWHENCIIKGGKLMFLTEVFSRSTEFENMEVLSPPTTWKRELRFTQGELYPTTTDGVRPREGSKNAGLLARLELR